ncbi:cell division protein ZapA [Arhodomonas sp. AD133]|uniref:cell division protein ZapA n=1 Tax=Arhodomonas sp. AD133 TaxID=3415009 RepID=UPI003EBC8BD9
MSEEPVKVRILDREYLVACAPEERDSLLEAAAYLDRHMREIRDSGKIVGSERIAVMAALNIASDLLVERRRVSDDDQALRRVASLERRIARVLDRESDSALGYGRQAPDNES